MLEDHNASMEFSANPLKTGGCSILKTYWVERGIMSIRNSVSKRKRTTENL